DGHAVAQLDVAGAIEGWAVAGSDGFGPMVHRLGEHLAGDLDPVGDVQHRLQGLGEDRPTHRASYVEGPHAASRSASMASSPASPAEANPASISVTRSSAVRSRTGRPSWASMPASWLGCR